MKVKLSELSRTVTKAIKSYGYNDTETKVIKEILLYAQLRGNNQGIVKLIGAGIPKRKGAGKIKIAKQTPVSALVNGNKNHAMIVMSHITDLAIQKAKKSGVGIVGSFNTSESTGAIGYYAQKIASKNLIGVVYAAMPFTTTAPYGANEARFCTNPIAYGIPTLKDPIILDFSTSAIAWYGLIEAKTAGKKVPKGCGFDAKGRETTDPAKIMGGAISTMGGHKGSGLAMMVQILAGPLVGADFFNKNSSNAGNLVMAIDPKIMTNVVEFKKEVAKMQRQMKSARKIKGVEMIYYPGERGNKFMEKVKKAGKIEIEDNLYKEVLEIAGRK